MNVGDSVRVDAEREPEFNGNVGKIVRTFPTAVLVEINNLSGKTIRRLLPRDWVTVAGEQRMLF